MRTLLLVHFSCTIVLGTALAAIIARSTRRHDAQWSMIRWIDRYAPKPGVPPETVDEYAALRLQTRLRIGFW